MGVVCTLWDGGAAPSCGKPPRRQRPSELLGAGLSRLGSEGFLGCGGESCTHPRETSEEATEGTEQTRWGERVGDFRGWVVVAVAVVWIFLGGWDIFFVGGIDCLHIPKIFCQVANSKKSEMPSC